MVKHKCGYEEDMRCKRCGSPLIENKGGLYCPHCGRQVTVICPGCGKPWL